MLFGVGMCTLGASGVCSKRNRSQAVSPLGFCVSRTQLMPVNAGPVIALKPWLQEYFQQQRGGAQPQGEKKEPEPYNRTRIPTARARAMS